MRFQSHEAMALDRRYRRLRRRQARRTRLLREQLAFHNVQVFAGYPPLTEEDAGIEIMAHVPTPPLDLAQTRAEAIARLVHVLDVPPEVLGIPAHAHYEQYMPGRRRDG